MSLESAREDVVSAPPKAEEGSEKKGRAKTMVNTTNTMVFELRRFVSGYVSVRGIIRHVQSSASSQWDRCITFCSYRLRTAPVVVP